MKTSDVPLALGATAEAYDTAQRLSVLLRARGYDIIYRGAKDSVDEVDYPDVALDVCRLILSSQASSGILIDDTGQGMQIAANKVHGIRAVLCDRPALATEARRVHYANILCLGVRKSETANRDVKELLEIIDAWLTEFTQGPKRQTSS